MTKNVILQEHLSQRQRGAHSYSFFLGGGRGKFSELHEVIKLPCTAAKLCIAFVAFLNKVEWTGMHLALKWEMT